MKEPTIRELLDDLRGFPRRDLAERVEAVLKLHVEKGDDPNASVCALCNAWWPCPTIRALNGEKL